MQAIKGWFGSLRRPQQQDVQQRTASLQRQLPKPVPSGLRPSSRPITASCSIDSEEPTSPTRKRCAESTLRKDETAAKRPKLQHGLAYESYQDLMHNDTDVEFQPLLQLRMMKRHQTRELGDELDSGKRTHKVIADKSGTTKSTAAGELQPEVGSETPRTTSPPVAADNVNGSIQATCCSYPALSHQATLQTSESMPPVAFPELGSQFQLSKLQGSIALRSRAASYVTSKAAHEAQDVCGRPSAEKYWPDSRKIPGSHPRGRNLPGTIDLPEKKPAQGVGSDLIRATASRGRTKHPSTAVARSPRARKQASSGKQQSKLTGLWGHAVSHPVDLIERVC